MQEFTLTAKEFIERSMKGEVFILKTTRGRYHYDYSKANPFRVDEDSMNYSWNHLDGIYLFTLEEPKPVIERRWKWRKDFKKYTAESNFIPDIYADESLYKKEDWYKVEDLYIDIEIKD